MPACCDRQSPAGAAVAVRLPGWLLISPQARRFRYHFWFMAAARRGGGLPVGDEESGVP